MSNPIKNRYDIVYFFEIIDGNPNGDPDAGNLPRIDPETLQGLVTDVCLKRKVRNFVGLIHGEQPPYEIYVKEKAVLNQQHERAYKAENIDPKNRGDAKGDDKTEEDRKPTRDSKVKAKGKGKSKSDPCLKAEEDRRLTRWMCNNFFDIRAFGAVMTTDVNCGQVRGPLQFGLARSLHRIVTQEHAVTRCAVTTEGEAEKQKGDNRTMGRKFTVPYALYRVHGYINANLASGPNGTGFSDDDLALFKRALDQMFESDRSAARANMRPVACVAFRHESPLGNARADLLFKRVQCRPLPGVQPLPGAAFVDGEGRPPRSSTDYELTIDEINLPDGVAIERWIEWA